jgi:hypothetical protein
VADGSRHRRAGMAGVAPRSCGGIRRSSSSRSRRGRRPGGGTTTVPRYRVPLCSRSSTRTHRRAGALASSPIRTAPPRRRQGASAERPQGRRPVRRLPARPRALRRPTTSRTPRPSCSTTPSTASPRPTARRSAAPTWSPPRLLPHRRAARALAAARAHRGRRRRRQVRRLRRRPRRHPTTHFVSVTENVQAYKVEGHRHARRARAGAERRDLHVRARTWCPSSRACSQLLRDDRLGEAEVRDLYRDAYEASPSSTWSTSRPAPTTSARPTAAGST